MKIRTQLTLLIVAIIFIPVIVFFASITMAYYESPKKIFIPGYDEFCKNENFTLNKKEWNRIADFVRRLPSDVDVAIAFQDGQVIYSTISDIKAGSIINNEIFTNFLFHSSSKYLYQIDTSFNINNENPSSVVIISRILKENRYKPNKLTKRLKFIVLFLYCMLIFCSIVIILIARSIMKSVSLLEKETKRLAEGNLEQEVKVKGGNEITSLTKSLNSMRISLRESQLRRSHFIMGISHDLRTPLALIKGYAEAISDGIIDSPSAMENSLKIIGSKVEQLEDMVDDLISFVKLDIPETCKQVDQIDLSNFLESYSKQFKSDSTLMGRTVITEINLPKKFILCTNERLLLRVLENLCGNAIRYTSDDGIVKLLVSLNYDENSLAKEVIISIVDNGVGIDKKDLPYIFDPFYRGSNSRREEGKGLGLAVVNTVSLALNWKLNVSSEKGKGSQFDLYIPV